MLITAEATIFSGDTMYYRKRICAYCGKEFYATAPGQKYCSYECRERAQREKRREYRRRRIKRGRGRSPKPKPGDKCIKCGYDILYALEYSHEVNSFLCANCHKLLHPGSERGMRNAVRGYPVKLLGALYDPGFPHEPKRCYLCKQHITPAIWEEHHMIPKSVGGDYLNIEDIVIVCANCHRILTRASDIIERYFVKFLNSELNPYYPHYTTLDQYERLGLAIKLEITRSFYQFLRGKWNEILNQLRQTTNDGLAMMDFH